MAKTKIEWTDLPWNVITGCTKISDGCQNCYVVNMAIRHRGRDGYPDDNPFQPNTFHENMLNRPYGHRDWKKPRKAFASSMGDLFHEDVTLSNIQRVFKVMNDCQMHTFQLLTKRPENVLKIADKLNWTPNIWLGVTVEKEAVTHRIDTLRKIPANIRFLSCEPLLSSLPDMNFEGIHWVIAGGESGNRARPMNIEWVRDIRDQCEKQSIPFFFKQWGTYGEKGQKAKRKSDNGKMLDGKEYLEFPV